jgi:hypothetical protein
MSIQSAVMSVERYNRKTVTTFSAIMRHKFPITSDAEVSVEARFIDIYLMPTFAGCTS